MLLGIDPKVDYAFKRLFGSPANVGLLIHLLNAVLDLPPGRQVADLEIQNPFNDKEFAGDKLSIVDIKARDKEGRLFNVEMQMLSATFFTRRILYYWARLFQQQLVEGDDYHGLHPTYSICFINDVLFRPPKEHHLIFRLLDASHKLTFAEELEIHVIELPKFGLAAEDLSSPLDLWWYFLRHAEGIDRDHVPKALDTPPLRQAVEVLTVMTQNEVERERYEARLKAQRDHSSFLAEAKMSMQKGIVIGRIQALQKVLKQTPSDVGALESLPMTRLEELAANLEREASPANGSP